MSLLLSGFRNFKFHGFGFVPKKNRTRFHIMSQASVSGTVHIVVEALNQVMGQWIKFPMEEQQIRAIKKQFWDNFRFPGVMGAIDGTHIAIWPPEVVQEHLYNNRKLYYSLNVMLVRICYFARIVQILIQFEWRSFGHVTIDYKLLITREQW